MSVRDGAAPLVAAAEQYKERNDDDPAAAIVIVAEKTADTVVVHTRVLLQNKWECRPSAPFGIPLAIIVWRIV